MSFCYSCSIERIIEKQNSEQVARNRLQLKVSIDVVKWLVFQGCSFRGRDEAQYSRNRDNFLELIKTLAFYNEDVGKIVLENAPQNAQYVSLTVQKDILSILARWNDLQALFAKKFPFAYYVHCLAHRLQLTLKVQEKLKHFKKTGFTRPCGQAVLFSPGRVVQRYTRVTNRMANRVPFKKILHGHVASCVLTRVTFEIPSHGRVTRHVSAHIIKSGNLTQRSEANEIYDAITSVEFIFILHFMIEMLGITDDLCQALQYKLQDILKQMQLASSTKTFLQKFREHGWDLLFEKVKLFCKDHEIEVPNLSISEITSKLSMNIASNDSLLIEMNSCFNDEVVKLLVLSSALNPCDNYKAISQEKLHMKIQLEHFELDAHQSTELQKASTVAELCQVLAKTNKSSIYPFLDRIIRLVLTLHVSTTITE
ncbi:hypothetical protein V6Z11_D06G088200 [Gossypium hirsutum]